MRSFQLSNPKAISLALYKLTNAIKVQHDQKFKCVSRMFFFFFFLFLCRLIKKKKNSTIS